MRRILIVEDDENLSRGITFAFEKDGYSVITAKNKNTGLKSFEKHKIDIAILDLGLPDGSGIELCKNIREKSNIPIIILTACDFETDEVSGLMAGADDYITKPFENKELVARVKAVLRRSLPELGKNVPGYALSFPGLSVSLASYEVYFEGKQVEMPPKELEVLHYLVSHPNMVFTREQLLEQVWGFDFFGDSRTVDVHIKRLREKLIGCEKYGWGLHTVWRVGYKFEYKS